MEGRIELITGPMFSGKTRELLRRVHEAEEQGVSVAVVKPALDERDGRARYGVAYIVSHEGECHQAQTVDNPELIKMHIRPGEVLGIDEAQFFDQDLAGVLRELRSQHCRVIAAGLDYDFRAKPFASVVALSSVADQIDVLSGVCARCGASSELTQRLIAGAPAPLDDRIIRLGRAELYEPRCQRCYFSERLLANAV